MSDPRKRPQRQHGPHPARPRTRNLNIKEKEVQDESITPVEPSPPKIPEPEINVAPEEENPVIAMMEKVDNSCKASVIAEDSEYDDYEEEEPQYTFNTYAIKKNKTGLMTKEYIITFQSEEKMRAKYTKPVLGDSTVMFSINSVTVALMKVTNGGRMFELATPEGSVWMEMTVTHPGGDNEYLRRWDVTIFDRNNNPRRLYSKLPVKNANGGYVLYFGGKLTIASTKNCILVDELENFEVIGVRKIGRSLLEVDGRSDFQIIDLFALAVASFIAN